MPPGFVHLHTHSEFSLLDGAARLDGLVKRAIELEMPALALTDHGVMYGALDFYTKCKAAGIKPIVGVEAYVAPGSHKDRGRISPPSSAGRGDWGVGEKNAYHLLLLAKNLQGYKNLLKLTTLAAVEGFYYKPRVDHELLRQYSDGIIATSACLGGEVCTALMKGDYEKARNTAGFYRDLFGADNYYIELQNHSLPKQIECNVSLLKIARELGLQAICTNDVHYLDQKDADAHDVLLCIGTGSTVNEPNRLRYEADQFYMKSAAEMAQIFTDHPATLEQTTEIASRCDLELEFGRAPLPTPDIPDGRTAITYLRQLAEQGLERKVGRVHEKYRQRLEYELGIVEQTGFAQYFLIVRDFALFAREKGIFFGVRGSAAGSLTSFCADITDIDPLDYELTFERFLNPERIQMPDIDMDFEDARRGEVIEYVTRKYGEDHVAQIVTFGTLAARAAIKDSGRALGMTIPDVNRVVGMIPTMPLGITISRALQDNPEFKQVYNREPEVKHLVDTAMRLEGVSRHASVHAAGVVISHEPLVEYTPLQRSADGAYVTQYSAGALEKIGLLKMDFLGLINLSILGRAVEAIKKSRGVEIDVQKIPLDDPKAFDMMGRGETTGIFQLESAGMRRYISELKPTSVRDLAAMVALYRPGPMEHIPTFIRAKHGLQKIQYPHPLLKEVLEETYGVIVYQDQVMRIAQAIAGYSLGQADILRRAMGKKKKEEMAKERANFLAGAATNGVPEKKASEIFDLIEPFAGYAFNKAHAVCYAMVAYQTAYLKANFSVEYMAALMACYTGKNDKVASCMEECARMKIAVLPPDVNLSDLDFAPERPESGEGSRESGVQSPESEVRSLETANLFDSRLSSLDSPPNCLDARLRNLDSQANPLGSRPSPLASPTAIRFGLVGIKNVGRGAVEAILTAREKGGKFTSLPDFCERAAAEGNITRSTIEALIQCGAFASIHANRRALMQGLGSALQMAANSQRDREMGQGALFGGDDEQAASPQALILPHVSEYATEEILAFEKDLLGIYVSDHPLQNYRVQMQSAKVTSIESLCELGDKVEVTLGGIISTVKPFVSKKSKEPMAFLTLEDLSGTVAVTVFPSVYREYGKSIVKDRVVLLTGKTSRRERVRDDEEEGGANVEILADSIRQIGPSANGNGAKKQIVVRLDNSNLAIVRLLRNTLENAPGDAQVRLDILVGDGSPPKPIRTSISVDPEIVSELRKLVGKQAVQIE